MTRTTLCGLLLAGVLQAQTQPAATPTPSQQDQNTPIYRVRVVGRTTKAVNYRRSGIPTPLDFQGTVLLPDAKGSAWVKANKGSTEVKAKFKKLPAPTRFGREYLTYVLWAITPEGRATNLGEIQTDNDDESKLNVTSDLQAFAMIVTAEPYFSVTQPSDVVVMENAVRKDTVGQVEMVDANYELLKRGEYSYDTAAAAQADSGKREKLPMHRYEALLAIYQAQNAVQIAQSLGAERLATESYAKASRLLLTARQYYDNKGDSKSVIQTARQAAQTAEDARLITIAKLEQETAAEARAAGTQPVASVTQ
ncbi:MAG: hypothetical protein WD733_11430 [Bryobacterales bacterium]